MLCTDEEAGVAMEWYGPKEFHPSVSDSDFFQCCIETDKPGEFERRRKFRAKLNEVFSKPETPENRHEINATMEHPWWIDMAGITMSPDHMSGELWLDVHPDEFHERSPRRQYDSDFDENRDDGLELSLHPATTKELLGRSLTQTETHTNPTSSQPRQEDRRRERLSLDRHPSEEATRVAALASLNERPKDSTDPDTSRLVEPPSRQTVRSPSNHRSRGVER